VLPFIRTYCSACPDSSKRRGGLDLSVYGDPDAVAADLERWVLVLEQLEQEAMPPARARVQPNDDERRRVIDWIRAVRKREAARHAGDPGPISARRLSNAEYDCTICDPTGTQLRSLVWRYRPT
jgi:hypothetical protein